MAEPQEKEEKKKPKGILGAIGGALGQVAENVVPGLGFAPIKELSTAAFDTAGDAFRGKKIRQAEATLDKLRKTQPPETSAPIDSGAGARAAAQQFAAGPENTQAAMQIAKGSQAAAGKAFANKRAQDLRKFYQDKSQQLRMAGADLERERDIERERPKFQDAAEALQSEDFENKVRSLGSIGSKGDIGVKSQSLKKY